MSTRTIRFFQQSIAPRIEARKRRAQADRLCTAINSMLENITVDVTSEQLSARVEKQLRASVREVTGQLIRRHRGTFKVRGSAA